MARPYGKVLKRPMRYDPDLHHRRSIRLKGFDYRSEGAYFVTLCTHGRACYFGEIVDDPVEGAVMQKHTAGEMVERAWLGLEARFEGLSLDEWILMPNHLHGIVILPDKFEWTFFDVMHDFKSWTTTSYCRGVHAKQFEPFQKRFWHRNYFERIIRSERELEQARLYIRNNCGRWLEDKLNPANPLSKGSAPSLRSTPNQKSVLP